MLKITSIDDKTIQRIVSDELASGLLSAFDFEAAKERIKLTQNHYKHIKEIFEWYEEDDPEAELYVQTDSQIKNIAKHIEKLYVEFLDEKKEYALDDFEKYILKVTMASSYSDRPDYVIDERIRKSGGISIRDELHIKEWLAQDYDKRSNSNPNFKKKHSKKAYIKDQFYNLTLFPYIDIEELAS